VTAAVEIAEQFLDDGKLIVSTQGRVRNQNIRFTSHAKKAYTTVPLAVLVNEGSAGSSEIVAEALKDWGRASIVGAQTFGRGSVQTILPLPDGSALKLTTARFYGPKGRSIHGAGVMPDVRVDADLLAADAQLRAAAERVAPPRR
jgi:carboxyl-terminal processing protease